jgi:phenylalanyl-tRNA synthetase alpha chain
MTTIFSASYSNVPLHIQQKVLQSPKLYQQPSHPLHTIKGKIEDYFGSTFTIVDSLSPIVTTQANFDSLLIPPHDASRSKSDTYYLTPEQCLRTHTSSHQVELLHQGYTSFLCTGDVYRKADIDSSHYPIFHQMEGVKVFHHHNNGSTTTPSTILSQQDILEYLRQTLTGLALHLFGPVEYRWVD